MRSWPQCQSYQKIPILPPRFPSTVWEWCAAWLSPPSLTDCTRELRWFPVCSAAVVRRRGSWRCRWTSLWKDRRAGLRNDLRMNCFGRGRLSTARRFLRLPCVLCPIFRFSPKGWLGYYFLPLLRPELSPRVRLRRRSFDGPSVKTHFPFRRAKPVKKIFLELWLWIWR